LAQFLKDTFRDHVVNVGSILASNVFLRRLFKFNVMKLQVTTEEKETGGTFSLLQFTIQTKTNG